MKKMNNKGFAISSLLYGLLLVAFLVVAVLISIMASNRKNTATLIDKIDDELSRYSNTATEFVYNSESKVQEFIVPYGMAGWYKIELWGASAATYDSDGHFGRGSYTSGTIYLEENTHLYFYLGQKGIAGTTVFNQINSSKAGAGGATDVRMISGGESWGEENSLKSMIMLAGGGGVETTLSKSNQGGNLSDSTYTLYNAGSSYIAGIGGQRAYTTSSGKIYAFVGGMMFHSINEGDGKARIELVSQSSSNNPPPKKSTILQGVKTITNCITAEMTTAINGEKELWTEINAIVAEHPTKGKGYNVIKNSAAVPTLVSGLSDGKLLELLDYNNREAKYTAGTHGYTNGTKQYCVTLTLDSTYNLEELTIYHYYHPTTQVKMETLSINYGSRTFIKTYDYANEYIPMRGVNDLSSSPITETKITDIHIDTLNIIPTGNYYITLASDEGRVVSANATDSTIKFYYGSKKQKWTISSIDGTNTYKIIETEDNYALQPKQTDAEGNFESGVGVATLGKYSDRIWELWEISHPTDKKNEYYMIKSKKNPSYCLTASENSQNAPLRLTPCNSNPNLQLFKFYNAEY